MSNIEIGICEITDAIQYKIPHIVVHAQVEQNQNKIMYILHNKLFRVEEYASHLLKSAGWSVFKGDDAHLFFLYYPVTSKIPSFLKFVEIGLA